MKRILPSNDAAKLLLIRSYSEQQVQGSCHLFKLLGVRGEYLLCFFFFIITSITSLMGKALDIQKEPWLGSIGELATSRGLLSKTALSQIRPTSAYQ